MGAARTGVDSKERAVADTGQDNTTLSPTRATDSDTDAGGTGTEAVMVTGADTVVAPRSSAATAVKVKLPEDGITQSRV